MELAARNAGETLAREQARWLADQGKTLAALEELADGPGAAPDRRCASSATTSRPSRAPTPSVRWSCSRKAGRGPASTAVSACARQPSPPAGRTTSPATARCCGDGSIGRWKGRRAAPRSCAGACPTWSSSMAAWVRRTPRGRSWTSLVCMSCPLWPGQGARGAVAARASRPIVLPATSQALYLVQRIRDEAHRFAITYHRQLRAKAQTKSVLDDLPGVGPARKRALLRVFGSASRCALRRSTRSPPCRASAGPGGKNPLGTGRLETLQPRPAITRQGAI